MKITDIKNQVSEHLKEQIQRMRNNLVQMAGEFKMRISKVRMEQAKKGVNFWRKYGKEFIYPELHGEWEEYCNKVEKTCGWPEYQLRLVVENLAALIENRPIEEIIASREIMQPDFAEVIAKFSTRGEEFSKALGISTNIKVRRNSVNNQYVENQLKGIEIDDMLETAKKFIPQDKHEEWMSMRETIIADWFGVSHLKGVVLILKLLATNHSLEEIDEQLWENVTGTFAHVRTVQQLAIAYSARGFEYEQYLRRVGVKFDYPPNAQDNTMQSLCELARIYIIPEKYDSFIEKYGTSKYLSKIAAAMVAWDIGEGLDEVVSIIGIPLSKEEPISEVDDIIYAIFGYSTKGPEFVRALIKKGEYVPSTLTKNDIEKMEKENIFLLSRVRGVIPHKKRN